MKKLSISALLIIVSFGGFGQTKDNPLYEGIWTEKDNGISEWKWTFHSNGNFNQITFWNNSSQVGGTISNGKFEYNNVSNTLTLSYLNYSLITNDKIETDKANNSVEWKIKSISENEIVINRLAKNELEKQLKSYDGRSVDVVLVRKTKLPY